MIDHSENNKAAVSGQISSKTLSVYLSSLTIDERRMTHDAAERKKQTSVYCNLFENRNRKYVTHRIGMCIKINGLLLLFIGLNQTTKQKKILPTDAKLVYC